MAEKVCVLVADDDAVTRRLLVHHLQAAGFDTIGVGDGQEAMARLSSDVTVAMFDLQMPKASGLECLRYCHERFPDTAVMVISQFGEIRDAVDAMKQGAFEYIAKPVDPDELLAHVRQAIRSTQLARENRQLKQAVSSPMLSAPFSGNSPVAKTIVEQVERIARLDSTVLITGESGTGKTTLARMIHRAGPRADAPFVAVSCGSLPRDLVESELFGHVRGAFTGAVADRPGKAEVADGGTLFLDEIGDLPLELQPKLLTFLQDKNVQRIGDHKVRAVDVRVIAATHQDLEEKCRDRSFRQDLFFRLNVLPIYVGPLRERPEDIQEFANYLLARIAHKRGLPPFVLSDDARRTLAGYPWPGNVRELENVLERASAFCSGSSITSADLGLKLTHPGLDTHHSTLAGMTLAEIEKQAILDTLKACGGNKKAAARQLGIDEKSIYNKMKRLGIGADA